MIIKIVYGVDEELNRVDEHMKHISWFKANNYEKRLKNPSKANFFTSSADEIKNAIRDEYDARQYVCEKREITSELEKHQDKFFKFIKRIFDNVPEEFDVILSKYGIGMYFEPNKIHILFKEDKRDSVALIFHEIIHILIEPYVKKYKLGHWEKERTVDLILHNEKLGLPLNYWQSNYFGVEEYIDEQFEKYFFTDLNKYFGVISKKAQTQRFND